MTDQLIQTKEKTASVSNPARRGLVLIFTGNGKGKTSAALGMIMRASAGNWRMAFLQFIKNWDFLSEHKTLRERFPEVEHRMFGEGFVGILGDKKGEAVHKAAAEEGLKEAAEMIAGGGFDLVILDEICGAVASGLLEEETVLELMASKPAGMHLVLTGRGATAKMMEAADLVTEMTEVKHPYRQGIQAQRGIDF